MSGERSRTPSPNRTRNLERGVFSSLSTLSFIKPTVEERKPPQPVPVRPASSVRSSGRNTVISRPNSSASPMRPARPDSASKAEAINRSPIKTNVSKHSENMKLSTDDTAKLQDSIKKLNLMLSKERKTVSKLEQDIMEIKQTTRKEVAQMTATQEKLQQSLLKMKASNKTLAFEREKIMQDLTDYKTRVEMYNDHMKSLASTLVICLKQTISTHTSLFSSTPSQFEVDEMIQQSENIKSLLKSRLELISKELGCDFTSEFSELNTWQVQPRSPSHPKLASRSVSKPDPRGEVKDEIDFIANEPEDISYTVEYFTDDSISSHGSTPQGTVRFARPETKPASNSENVLITQSDEVSFTTEAEFAVAMYDFDGERVRFN